MSRQRLGYRARATRSGKFVYVRYSLHLGGYFWDEKPSEPQSFDVVKSQMCAASGEPIDYVGNPIEVSDVKIVAVYLRTKGEPSHELSDFNQAVVDEIDRRDIDAIVEPEDFGGMPTTIRFRAPNGAWIWIPIIACSVVDGFKEERAKKTVDWMLAAIQDVASTTLVHHMEAVLESRNAP